MQSAADTVLNAKDNLGLYMGWIDPNTYHGRDPAHPLGNTISAMPKRGVFDRFGEGVQEMTDASGTGVNSAVARYGQQLGNSIFERVLGRSGDPNAAGFADRQNAADALDIRDKRAQRARVDMADPAFREDGSRLGNLSRAAGGFLGSVVGDINPLYMINPGGASWAARAARMGGVMGATDVGLQAGEIHDGVQDKYDPMRTVEAAGMGATFQGGSEVLHGAWNWARGRPSSGRPGAPGGPSDPAPELHGVTLDGGVSPDVHDTLASVGSSVDHFTSPEAAAAAAERIVAARARSPVSGMAPNPRDVAAEQARRQSLADGIESGDVDPSLAPQDVPRVMPDGSTMTAHPEGLVRDDELGSIMGLLRHRAANQNVLGQAEARAADNPVLAAILNSTATADQQAGAIWQRINDMDRQARETAPGAAPLESAAPHVPPHQRPTVDSAAGKQDGIALPVKGRITSGFGAREAPKAGASTNHQGIDIAVPRGTDVVAPHGGTVIMAGDAGKSGNLIRIDHGNGVVSAYAHLDGFNVKIGQRVEAGAVIGKSGNTGNSTGAHLHYAIKENGVARDPRTFRFNRDAAPSGQPDYVVPPRGEGNFADQSSPAERDRAQSSPTDDELERGAVYQQPDEQGTYKDGIFTEGPRGKLYESPMATRGDEPRRPATDDPHEAPPGYQWRGDTPRPDGGPGPRDPGGSGEGFHEDRVKQQMDDMLREYEASQSRRREREQQQREQGRQQDPGQRDPGEQYAKHGQKPHMGDDGNWHLTPEGFLADKAGNPVGFNNHVAAAKWATSNKMAGDFELHTWGTNSNRVVLKRRENSNYGDAPGADTNGTASADSPESPSGGGATDWPHKQEPGFEREAPAAGRSRDRSQRQVGGDQATDGAPEGSGVPPTGRTTEATAPEPAKPLGRADPNYADYYKEYDSPRTAAEAIKLHTGEGDPEAPEFGRGWEAGRRGDPAPDNLDSGFADGWHVGNSTFKAHGPMEAKGATETVTPKSAPESSAKPEPRRVAGKNETVVTPTGREVGTKFEVRELKDVQQATGDRQPRDRSRDASDEQVAKIASKLDPEQLHSNRQAAHGAPIIGPDGVLEVGNGRARAIERAYDAHPEKAEAYKQMIRDQGHNIDGFDRPILVRRRTSNMSKEDMRSWVNEAQDSGTMGYSAPEQAKADAGRLGDDALESYRGGELNTAGNREFVKRWLTDTKADTNEMLAKDGTLSPDGTRRIQASILHKAFGDDTLVGKLLGDSDNNIKAIGNALTDLAPKFVQVKNLVEAGKLPAEFDISGKVADMAGLISRARAEGKKLSDLVAQSDMFGGNVDPATESLVRLMFKDEDLAKPRSQVRLKEGFDFYLEDAKQQEGKGPGLFGDEVKPLTPVDMIEAARASLEAKDSKGGQSTFFKLADRSDEAPAGGRTTSLDKELSDLAHNTEDPAHRELAERLNGPDLADVTTRYGKIDDKAELGDSPGMGKQTSGFASAEERLVRIGKENDPETLLHEATHIRLMQIYGEEFDKLRPGDAGEGPARELIRLYNEARSRAPKGTRPYGLTNVDEFVAEAVSSKSFQRFLQRGPIWTRLVDAFRKVLGLPIRMRPMLDDVLRASHALIDAAHVDAAARKAGGAAPKVIEFGRKGTSPVARKIVDTEGLVRDGEKIRAAVGDPMGTLGKIMRPIKDGVSWLAFSSDSRGRAIADRIKSGAAHELLDHFYAAPGKLDGKDVGRTYHEAVQRYANGRSQEAFRALDGVLGKPESERRVADLLRFPNKRTQATAAELAAAQKLKAMFKDAIEYRKGAGESIGEVGDGYFPRWLHVEKVMQNQSKFLAGAEKLYRGAGVEDSVGAARGWLNHVVDTYAGLDGGLDIRRATGDSVGSMTAQARAFGKQADTLLADFYQDDLLQVTSQYFHGTARRAEQARRFGIKGAEGSAERRAWLEKNGEKTQLQVLENRIRDDAHDAGELGHGAMGVLQDVIKANLGHVGAMSNGVRKGVAWLHTWTQLGVMDKAIVTSISEMTNGFTRGGLGKGLPFIRDSLMYYQRQLRHAPPDVATRWAEALGVVQDAVVNQALINRAGIEGGTSGSQKLLASYYTATTLHQYTEGTRIAAVKMGQELIRQFSHDMVSSSPRIAKRASQYLSELGVKDPAGFAQHVRDGGFTIDEVSRDTSQHAADYGTAVIRFANQTIMRPTRAEKPVWANHPLGSMFFSLMSYSYAFKKNIMDRVGRMIVHGVKERDPTLFVPAAGLAGLVAFQAMMDTYVRPAVFGGGPPKKETKAQMVTRVVDRAGLTGGLSPVVNAVTGVRYQRSLAESLLGPVIGRPLDMATKLIQLELKNKHGHSNAEARAAAGAVYDNVLEPAIDGVASARLLGVARTAAVMGTGNRAGGIVPGDRDYFVDAVAGKAHHKGG